MNHQAKLSRKLFVPLASLALVLSGCSDSASGSEAPREPPLAGATIGGDFELANSQGETVRWTDFKGSYRIVYFGFAYCPDICPTDVQRFTQALRVVGEKKPEAAAKIRSMFISIDPERDTPEVLAEFTSAFSDDLIGLTGTPDQIKTAADAFKVYYERGEDTNGGGYLMNHSNVTYLFDPYGKPLATLPTDQGAQAVADEIMLWVN
ncbi:MAG: SCO family protein [Erythrobacter sp.]